MPKQKYTFGEIKRYLQGQPPLHFRGLAKEDVSKALTKFLNNFFEYNTSYDTYQGNTLQTAKGRRRSIGDIYRICYYYFPKITLTHVYEAVISHINEGKAVSAICKLTHMRVYRGLQKGYEKPFFNGEIVDEFGVDFNQFEDFEKCPKNTGGWGTEYTSKDLKIIQI